MAEDVKKRLGDYEIIAEIGGGAQGKIFKARCVVDCNPNTRFDEIVALKVVRRFGDDDKSEERFEREIRIFLKLKHPNLVEYREAFTVQDEWSADIHCLVMEYLEGEDLSVRLKDHPQGLPFETLKPLFIQALEGLVYARENGIIHRDLKPGNIFLLSNGRVKVIDFGIARKEDGTVTTTAGFKGTYDYMAPDFLTAGDEFRGDELSDIFSMGVCFYKALTGRLPYAGSREAGWVAYLNRWQRGKLKDVSVPGGPLRALNDRAAVFMRKALRVDRNDRYGAFKDMLNDLRLIDRRRLEAGKHSYEFTAYLGKGGFGEVYKARRLSDGRLFAVKRMFPGLDPSRFQREARLLQKYPHPNIVSYEDFATVKRLDGEDHYLLMEYLDGMPGWGLRNRIKQEGALDVEEVRRLFDAWLAALDFLHTVQRKPILHRDITPANLYAPPPDDTLEAIRIPKLFDMGIARSEQTLTGGHVPGNPEYMAPEFVTGADFRGSIQSDLYCVGLCLYESLTGSPAFERLSKQTAEMWQGLKSRSTGAVTIGYDHAVFRDHPGIERLVRKAIAREPEKRFRSAAEMRAAVKAMGLKGVGSDAPAEADQADDEEAATVFVPQSEVVRAAASMRRDRIRRMGLWAGAAAAGLLLVGSAVWLLSMRDNEARATRTARRASESVLVFEPTAAYAARLRQTIETGEVLKSQYPDNAELASLRSQLTMQGTLLEKNFEAAFRDTLVAGHQDQAGMLVREWKDVQPLLPFQGLNAFGHHARLSSMENRLDFVRALSEIKGPDDALRPGAAKTVTLLASRARQGEAIEPLPDVKAWWATERETLRAIADGVPTAIRQKFSEALRQEDIGRAETLARQWAQAVEADANSDVWPDHVRETVLNHMTGETARLMGKYRDMALAEYAAGSLDQADKLDAWFRHFRAETPTLAAWVRETDARIVADIAQAQQARLDAQIANLPRRANLAEIDDFKAKLDALNRLYSHLKDRWTPDETEKARQAIVAACAMPARHHAERAVQAYGASNYTQGHLAFETLKKWIEAIPPPLQDPSFDQMLASAAKAHDQSRKSDAETLKANAALETLRLALAKAEPADWQPALKAWGKVEMSAETRAGLQRSEPWLQTVRLMDTHLSRSIGEAENAPKLQAHADVLNMAEARAALGDVVWTRLTALLNAQRAVVETRARLARIRASVKPEDPEGWQRAFAELALCRAPDVFARKAVADEWHETERALLSQLKDYADRPVEPGEKEMRLNRTLNLAAELKTTGFYDAEALAALERTVKDQQATLAQPVVAPPSPYDDPEADDTADAMADVPVPVPVTVPAEPVARPDAEKAKPVEPVPDLPTGMTTLMKPVLDLLEQRSVREAVFALYDGLPRQARSLPAAKSADADFWSALRLRVRIVRDQNPLLDLAGRAHLDSLDAEFVLRQQGTEPDRWRQPLPDRLSIRPESVTPVRFKTTVALSAEMERELAEVITFLNAHREREAVAALCDPRLTTRLQRIQRRRDAENQWPALLDWLRQTRRHHPFLDYVDKTKLDEFETQLEDFIRKETPNE